VQDRILRAAAACFRERGVEGTSMADIATAAGLQRPNLYRYFPNKEAVVLEVLMRETRAVHAERRALVRLAGPVGPLLAESLVSGQALARDDELIRFAMTGEAAEMTAGLVRSESLLFAVEKAYWEPLLAYGRERGELRDDLTDDEIVRWFFVSQFLMFSHEDFFPAEAVRAQVERFVVPAVLADPRSASVRGAARSTPRSRSRTARRPA
jgi:AcrR family transcriptional regulator